ncbi:MAG TPA: hypothetical protein PLA94_21485 [Myxococcota bacterium]|nr:hypothetical protein [Myxococcota bacterium]HND32589.1 hypothetical protein [Myxococcota bacterium]
MRSLLFLSLFLLLGADPEGCGGGKGYLYTCECWTGNSAGLTVGNPSPCGADDEDAMKQAVDECSEEVGDTCFCECSTGGKSCDGE